jgi:hypothetical protein
MVANMENTILQYVAKLGGDVKTFRGWWTKALAVPRSKLTQVYFKKDKSLTHRTNASDLYHGLLRIKVHTSTSLNRRINGWISGIVAHCRIV